MKQSHTVNLLLFGVLLVFSLTLIFPSPRVIGSSLQLPVPVDLVSNWDFTESEPGGWDGNDHNVSKPMFWHFSGDSNGPKEQYRLINDTENGGDADTLFLQPTRTNQEHTIMFWQDFTPLDINHVTIQYRSCATGPSAVILLYGLNESIAPDTPLPNGTLPYLTTLHPCLNETPGYWTNYTTVTCSLTNFNTTYHHYRIHWQIIEAPGKPDAQLYINYCRVTEPQLPLPPFPPLPGVLPMIYTVLVIVVIAVLMTVMVLSYLKHEGKLNFPSIRQ
ncbi:MAG: hypothetical protein ACFFCJ_05920 [Promethearchaeota archaeon]